jgi:hypothetical protein
VEIEVTGEAGWEDALIGMSYSHFKNDVPVDEWWVGQKEKAVKRARLLAFKGGGHNKFLESICIWIDINASRAFWSEFDTYRAGMTKQSTSTMHTLSKRPPKWSDFESGTPEQVFSQFLNYWCEHRDDGIMALKHGLPEAFMQRRRICTNYKTLQNIIAQRRGHRYKFWDTCIDAVLEQCEHPYYLEQSE